MTLTSKPQPPATSIFHPQNQGPQAAPKDPVAVPVPTMTNQSVLGAPPPVQYKTGLAEELGPDIVAKPLSSPDFITNVQPYLLNQNLIARWIFTDRRRYSQAKVQGYRNCTKQDFKPEFAALAAFEEEGGTKFINGDLILMLVDRRRYLAALRHKHDVAYRLSEAATARRASAQKARSEMGAQVETLNRQRAAQGLPPLMSVFDPSKSDLEQVGISPQDLGRLGNPGATDTGKLGDLK